MRKQNNKTKVIKDKYGYAKIGKTELTADEIQIIATIRRFMIDKVKIGGKDYTVIEMQESFASDGKVCDGDISYSMAEIRVAVKNKSKQYIDTVLLHEIVHGILYEFNIKIPEEENFTEGFAKGLYQVLKDNQRLLGEIGRLQGFETPIYPISTSTTQPIKASSKPQDKK